jgi:hypothetical protein
MSTPRFGSWIEQYDPQTLPVQVCGVRNGQITEDGYGVERFANIREARAIYPDLPTSDQTSRNFTRFIGPCRERRSKLPQHPTPKKKVAA